MSTETFEIPLASAERWADDVMGLAMDLAAICDSMTTLGKSVTGLDPKFDAILHMAQDARRIASDLLLDLAGHGVLPATPPGDADIDDLIGADGPNGPLPAGRRRVSAEQIQAMASVFAVTDGEEPLLAVA